MICSFRSTFVVVQGGLAIGGNAKNVVEAFTVWIKKRYFFVSFHVFSDFFIPFFGFDFKIKTVPFRFVY
jgi:hypothetical protein